VSDTYVKPLSWKERELIQGKGDLYWEEPRQILPGRVVKDPVDERPTKQRLLDLRKRAAETLDRVGAAISKLDARCSHLEVEGVDDGSSSTSLYQAMTRVFGQGSNTVTYSQYVRAIALQKQLAAEDAEVLRKR